MSSLAVDLGAYTNISGLGAMPVFSGQNVMVNNSGAAQSYSYTFGGVTRTFSVPDGATMQQFAALFNADATAGGLDIRASIKATGSGYEIQMTNAAGDTVVQPENVTTTLYSLRGTADNWYSRQATDARFTLNGWPQELTSSSNTLTEVIEGLTITIKSVGEANLAVNNDKEALKENIKGVVDAINALRGKIRELTKVDKDKDVKGPETDDSTGTLKLASQFTWQKGSALTGNYGVQLLSARINDITAKRGIGYIPKADATDAINDLYCTLSQIGITTITDEKDENFGLLKIDEAKLDEAIDKDIRNVAELFSADDKPSTDSSDFMVASVGTRAKPGVYNVTYDVDPGTRQAVNVRINGVLAATDSAFPGRWTVADMDNAAAGLAIQFSDADLTPGSHSSTVRVKEGKVNEMMSLISAELEPVAAGQENRAGSLPLLISNYNSIIKNIDKKIDRETERLVLWESRMKAKFARLDALLGKYNQQMERDAATLAQLDKKD
jgi:flagellar hook-associated protein 2